MNPGRIILSAIMAIVFHLCYGQNGKENNCLIDAHIQMITASKDTIYEALVRYVATEGDFLNNTDDDYYQKLRKDYRIKNLICCSPLGCDSNFFYPFLYDKKYAYTLYHKKTKEGKYVDWQAGDVIRIRFLKFHRFYLMDRDKRFGPVSIITSIEKAGQKQGPS